MVTVPGVAAGVPLGMIVAHLPVLVATVIQMTGDPHDDQTIERAGDDGGTEMMKGIPDHGVVMDLLPDAQKVRHVILLFVANIFRAGSNEDQS